MKEDNEISFETNPQLPEWLKPMNTNIKYDNTSNNTDNNAFVHNELLDIRDDQDTLFFIVNNEEITDDDKLQVYKKLIENSTKNNNYKIHMLEQIYTGDITKQGKPINCPFDIHRGKSEGEDQYQYIFGEETDAKIKDNCNFELFKQINETEITHGMMKHAEGHRWLNGIIVHNKNSIIIRDEDNFFGQPGFLSGVYFYNRLSVEIMNRYIIPKLVSAVNENKINTIDGRSVSLKIILDTYENVYPTKMVALYESDENLNEAILFEDAPASVPRKEELKTNKLDNINSPDTIQNILNEQDRKIDFLVEKVEFINAKFDLVVEKLRTLEHILLDISTKMKERVNK
jgi:hypothetical protein